MRWWSLTSGFVIALLVAGPAGQGYFQDSSLQGGATDMVADTVVLDRGLYAAWRIQALEPGYLQLTGSAAQDTSTSIAYAFWAWPMENPGLRREWWTAGAVGHPGERLASEMDGHRISHASNVACQLGNSLHLPECGTSLALEGPVPSGEWIVLAVVAADGRVKEGSELQMNFKSPGLSVLGKRVGDAALHREKDFSGGTTAHVEGFGFQGLTAMREGSIDQGVKSSLWGFVLAHSNTGLFNMTHQGPDGAKPIQPNAFHIIEGDPSGQHAFWLEEKLDVAATFTPSRILILAADVELP